MKVLLVTDYLYEQGGIYTHVMNLKEGLEKAGHEVKILHCSDLKTPKEAGDLSYRAFKERGLLFRILQFYNPFAALEIARAIRRFKPDIVHLHYIFNQSSPAVIIIPRIMKVPVVFTVHGFEAVHFNKRLNKVTSVKYKITDIETGQEEMLFPPVYLYKWLKFKWYQYSFSFINVFLAPSIYALNLLTRSQKERAILVPHGIQLLKFKPINNWYSLLYVGRLIKGKGVDTIVGALPEVLKVYPEVKLVIVGDGPARRETEYLVNSLGLNKNVEFLGRIPHSEVRYRLATCTIFIIPSTRPETFSIAGVEAMSIGRPIIASDIGAVKEWLMSDPSGGALFKPSDQEELADEIITLLGNKSATLQISKASASKSLQYGTDTMVKKILDIYADVLEGR